MGRFQLLGSMYLHLCLSAISRYPAHNMLMLSAGKSGIVIGGGPMQIPLERHAHSANGGMRLPDYSA